MSTQNSIDIDNIRTIHSLITNVDGCILITFDSILVDVLLLFVQCFVTFARILFRCVGFQYIKYDRIQCILNDIFIFICIWCFFSISHQIPGPAIVFTHPVSFNWELIADIIYILYHIYYSHYVLYPISYCFVCTYSCESRLVHWTVHWVSV